MLPILPGCYCCHPLPGMTPPSSHIIAPDRLLSVQEAGAALLSPLSHYSYITHTKIKTTPSTHMKTKKRGGGGSKEGEARRGAERVKDMGVKKREVVSEGGVNEASAFQ